MLLFVGLGNPDPEHERNRHNVGFMAVHAIAKYYNVSRFLTAFKKRAEVADVRIGSEDILLMKPLTYMNLSGSVVLAAAHFLKVKPNNIVAFHDEIELPPGKVRVKVGGSDAGHNGLRSITECIGSEYRRVRIGVGRPRFRDQVHSYVLSNFAKSERPWVDTLCEIIAHNAELLVKGQDASFQNKVHLSMGAKFIADPIDPNILIPRPKENPRES